MSQIELYSKLSDPMKAVEVMGTFIARSGMFGCAKTEQGQVIALVCMTEQITLMDFHRTYDVLSDNRIRMKAGAALAEFIKRGGSHEWLKTGEDGKEALLKLTDKNGKTVTTKFSIEDAKKMGASFKDGSAWVKTPGNMLRARCESNGVAMLDPGIYCGTDDSTPEMPALNLTKTDEPPVGKVLTPDFKPSQVHVEPAKEVKTEVVIEQPAEVVETPKPKLTPAGELPVETVNKLIEVIGEGQEATDAMHYMTSVIKPAWLQPGQHLGNLTVGRANMILNGVERFKKAVADAAAKAK